MSASEAWLARIVIVFLVAARIGSGHKHKMPDDQDVALYEGARRIVFKNTCRKKISNPVDAAPIRSPQAVHTVLAQHFAGKHVLEFGTRHGDGIACFAHKTLSAVAVEMDSESCVHLADRAGRDGRPPLFKIQCQPYQALSGLQVDADVFTWWQEHPKLVNEEVLALLAHRVAAGEVRSTAEAYILFDHAWEPDIASLNSLRSRARWTGTIAFDERELCRARYHNQRGLCKRAAGNMTITAVPLAPLAQDAQQPALASEAARCKESCDLILTYCAENLMWLRNRSEHYRRIFIYSKCGNTVAPEVLNEVQPHPIIIRAPNVGSNDYAVLHHIISHYNDLAPLSIFCEGADWFNLCHADHVLRPSSLRVESSGSLGHLLYPPFPQFLAPDLTCLKRGFCSTRPVCGTFDKGTFQACGRVKARKDGTRVGIWAGTAAGIGGFSLKQGHAFQHSKVKAEYYPSMFANMSDWLVATVGDDLANSILEGGERLALGGFFAAESSNLRRYPRELYIALADQQKHSNEEVDHFIERLWGLLLTYRNAARDFRS
jgi:hypothetical protein